MKHTKIILAALLSLTLTACGDTSTAEVTETLAEVTENTSSISETVEEETEAETTTAEETTVTTEAETTTESETTASETEAEIYEDIYGLDSALDASILTEKRQLPEIGVTYLLWQSDDGNTSVYGIKTEELEKYIDESGDESERNVSLVIIKHDNIIDTFNHAWFGAYCSVLQVKPFEEQKDCLYTNLYIMGGMPFDINDMTLFVPNSEGNYEMFSPDKDKLVSEITSRITVSMDKEQQTITFETGDVKHEIIDEHLEDVSLKDIICKSNEFYGYSYSDGKIICTFIYGNARYMGGFLKVNAGLAFKDGEFTVGDIEFSDY